MIFVTELILFMLLTLTTSKKDPIVKLQFFYDFCFNYTVDDILIAFSLVKLHRLLHIFNFVSNFHPYVCCW